jgi:hypothetical protein
MLLAGTRRITPPQYRQIFIFFSSIPSYAAFGAGSGAFLTVVGARTGL